VLHDSNSRVTTSRKSTRNGNSLAAYPTHLGAYSDDHGEAKEIQGFRTEQGLEQFCRIRGCISTVKKQGGNALKALNTTFQEKDMLQFVRLESPD
jgi:hypothetical protein